ncbi:MAG TPA: AMP-binding protein [Ramlibacter sp.]|nr:AMP-binding protein [Ramlibacter sp.]
MDLSNWIEQQASRAPAKTALRFEGSDIAYAALAGRIGRIASALAAHDVHPGERIAWLGLNSPDMLAALFACARLGATFMPLNWRLAAPEHQAMLRACPASLLIADDAFAANSAAQQVAPSTTTCVALGPAVPAGWTGWNDFLEWGAGRTAAARPQPADAPVLLCYTSGSTGRPKGALLSQAALACNADNSVDMHGLAAGDRVLTTLPLFHVGGLNIQTLPALREGCTVTLHPKFDPDATFDAIERDRITLTVLVPAQLDAMMAHPRWNEADFSSLRMISTGSTQVPMRIIRAVHARGVPLIQVWGATETAPIAACLHADEAMRKPGSTGRVARHCELRIAGVAGEELAAGTPGEVWVRGANVMSGYWDDPEASAKALAGGWFHSGDLGHLDGEGYLTIDGRLKDMIISGGENVSPAEVEAVLLDCPDIAEAAVVGRPDPRWGEVVVAVVVPAPQAALERERVMALFEGRLARFKQPKDVVVVSALPRTAIGKVSKEDVRQLVARLAAAGTAQEERIA